MNNAKELRKITDAKNKYKSKQFKYTLKLFRKLNRLARRGKSKYIITPYYMPKWFTNEYEEQLINILKDYEFNLEIKANYNGQGGFYRTLIIRW